MLSKSDIKYRQKLKEKGVKRIEMKIHQDNVAIFQKMVERFGFSPRKQSDFFNFLIDTLAHSRELPPAFLTKLATEIQNSWAYISLVDFALASSFSVSVLSDHKQYQLSQSAERADVLAVIERQMNVILEMRERSGQLVFSALVDTRLPAEETVIHVSDAVKKQQWKAYCAEQASDSTICQS